MPAQWLALQAVAHQSKQSVESCACPFDPPPDKSASPLPVQHRLRLFQHGQQASSVAASNPSETSTRRPRGRTTANPPLVAVPLIPPPQACRCSPPLPRQHFARSSWWLRLSRFCLRLFRQKSSVPLLRHASGKILAAQPAGLKGVDQLLHSARLRRAELSQACVFSHSPTSSRLLLGR